MFVLQEITEEQEEGNEHTDRSVVSEDYKMLLSQWPFHPPIVWFSTLQFCSPAVICGMNAQRVRRLLDTRKTIHVLDPDEHVFFIYDGVLARNNPAIPGPNTELKKLPPYSPFLNIVERAISFLKAVIKADISRPEIQEQMNSREKARRRRIAVGIYRTRLLQQALQRIIGTITAAKCGQRFCFMQMYLLLCLNSEAIEG